MKALVIIPVHNERDSIASVLKDTLSRAWDVLIVDDGSTDGTEQLLAHTPGVKVLCHYRNMGYGRSLIDGFNYAVSHGYQAAVTMDGDGQHEPARAPAFLAELADADIVSGSRYTLGVDQDSTAPADRIKINRLIAEELNRRLGLQLTDAFCGFKAYRTEALKSMRLTESGYAMPVELWVQAASLGLRIKEIPVKRIYDLMAGRTFGGRLDEPEVRLNYYRQVLTRAMVAVSLQASAVGVDARGEEPCGQMPRLRHPSAACRFQRE